MKSYTGIIILRPNIKAKKIDGVQASIINLFKQNTNVKEVWYLGKNKLDFYNSKYDDGIYLKLDLQAKDKKIEMVKKELRNNTDIISTIIMNNDAQTQSQLMVIKKQVNSFFEKPPIQRIEQNKKDKKIYMLINKNIKLPFSDNEIVAISEDKEKIFQIANKKIQELVYAKGFRTAKPFKVPKDIENELRRTDKVQFTLGHNMDVGQELVIKEKTVV